jgi:uncharacterized protein (UPF0332 family)
MTEDEKDLLLQARDSVSAARLLLQNGYPGYAASRAYYAMFYVAEAFLKTRELAFSKHSAVIAAFGREFANTGVVPIEFQGFLIKAQEMRHRGDYGSGDPVDVDTAAVQIEHAERFLEVAQQLIGSIPLE